MLRYRAKQLAVGVLIHLPESLRRWYTTPSVSGATSRLERSAGDRMLRRAPWPVDKTGNLDSEES